MAVESPGFIFVQSGGETAERARRAVAALAGLRGGIVAAGDLAVAENGTPNMSVNVATGQVVIPGTEGTFQGHYVIENRGTLNVAIAAADGTNPRKDLIVAKVQDAAYSGASNIASIVAVTGTPAASPAEPAAPANSWVLAMVDVPALDTAITNSQITDRRTQQTGQKGRAAALGGVVVCTAANRPAHSEGLAIYETDTDLVYVSDGATWRVYPRPDQAGTVLEFTPGGNIDTATSATFATWITLGNVTVPSWASAARYTAHVNGWFGVTSSTNNALRLKVGSVSDDNSSEFTGIVSERRGVVLQGRISGLSTGAQSTIIEYKRTAGTGTWRVDANGHVAVRFEWEA